MIRFEIEAETILGAAVLLRELADTLDPPPSEVASLVSDPLLDDYTVQRRLVLTPGQVSRLVRSGDLPAFKVGNKRVFRTSDVEEYVRRQEFEAEEPASEEESGAEK
jgi:excisionase family DNA binding protein